MPRNRFTLAEAQDAISDLTAHIQELKKEIKKGSDSSSTGAQNNAENASRPSYISLDLLPKFDRQLLQCAHYKSMINLSIFTNPKLDNTMKIMYISSTTTGEARQMAETLIARGNTAEQI